MSYIGNVPTTAAFPFDQFSGTGSQTAFTLTYAPAGTTSIIVTVTGVVQNPNTYSTVGTTLTFTGAPPLGTNNIGIVYLGLPVIGVSSPGNTAYQTAQDFTATASQTTFTTAGTYTVGFVNVYRNGLRLGDADFTATTTTTVVLANACTSGDLVTVVYFTLTSIVNAIPQSGGTVSGSLNVTGDVIVPTGTLYPLVSGTAVSTTSGTLWDFTGIPTTAKRVTVMYRSLSTNGTSIMQIQLGTTSGIEATGYSSVIETAASRYAANTGFQLTGVGSATWSLSGTVVLTLLNSTNNTWVANILAADGLAAAVYTGGGYKLTSGALSQLRITTVNGTDTFDAGQVNILWE